MKITNDADDDDDDVDNMAKYEQGTTLLEPPKSIQMGVNLIHIVLMFTSFNKMWRVDTIFFLFLFFSTDLFYRYDHRSAC